MPSCFILRLNSYKMNYINKCNNDPASATTIKKFTDFLISNSNLMFTQFETPLKRKKNYEQELGFIKPEQDLLKTACSFAANNTLLEKSDFGYFIPFEATLTKQLQHMPKNINLNKFYHLNRNQSNLKCDFFDGKYVKKILSNKFDSMPNFLLFLLYCDDVEFTNAVGSSRTKHKMSIEKLMHFIQSYYLNLNLYFKLCTTAAYLTCHQLLDLTCATLSLLQ